MNRIHKVIWSEVKKCWIVTPETAKLSRKVSFAGNKILMGTVMLGLLLGNSVCAPAYAEPGRVLAGDGNTATGRNSVVWGFSSTASGEQATAFGGNTTASGYGATAFGASAIAGAYTYNGEAVSVQRHWQDGKYYVTRASDGTQLAVLDSLTDSGLTADNVRGRQAVAFGVNVTASGSTATAFGRGTIASGENATSFGLDTFASGISATAFGNNTTASGDMALAFGNTTAASGEGATAFGNVTVAAGNYATALGNYTKADGLNSLAVGDHTTASGEDAVAMGTTTTASGLASTAMGNDTTASGDMALAFGNKTEASGEGATASGNVTAATGNYATALGNYTKADGLNSLAIGDHTTASGEDAVAMGTRTTASGLASTAMGNKTTASGRLAVAMGNGTTADGTNSVAMGENTNASGRNSVAMGVNTVASGYSSTALGDGSIASGTDSLASGYRSQAQGIASVALGNSSAANASNSLAALGGATVADATGAAAIGRGASAGVKDTFAIGANASTSGENTLALGNNASASEDFAIAIGYDTKASGLATTAVGDQSNATGERASAFGYGSKATATDATAIGYSAQADGTDSAAVGPSAKATGSSSTAVGANALGSGDYASAFGNGARAEGIRSLATGYSAQATGVNAVATGMSAQASGTNALASGTYSVASGRNSIATGNAAQATGNQAIALGYTNTVSGNKSGALGSGNVVAQDNTYVIGNGITSTQANSIILGNDSTDREATTVASAVVKGLEYTDFAGAGSVANGVLSVGAEGAERQIINVAAGEISETSTDAVNGSQLYAVTGVIGNMGNSVVNLLGGNADIDVNGNVSISNIGGTGENTVNDAIQAAYDKEESVEAGSTNVVVNQTGLNATNGKIYTVDLAKDIVVDSVDAGTVNTTTLQAGDTTVNSDGLTINNGPSITKTGIDAGGNTITNVAAGVNDTDAVNVSQLNQVINADQGGGFGLTAEDGNSVKKNLGETVSVVGDGTNITTSVVDGKVQVTLQEDIEVNSVTAHTVDAYAVNATTVVANTVDADTVNATTVNVGDTTITSDGLTIKNGPSITKTGIDAADNKVTNVADGEISANSKDAVNGSQIHQIVEDIKQQHTAVTVNEGTVAQEGVYNESGNLQIKQDTAANGKVTYDIKLNDNLTVGGASGKDGSITINDKDGNTGVSVSASDGVGHISLTGEANGGTETSADVSVKNGEAGLDGNDVTRIVYQDETGTERQLATMDDGLKFGANSGTTALNKLNSTVNIVGEGTKADDDYSGANIKTFVTQDGNGDTSITVKMDKNLSSIDSIAINGKDGKDGSEGAIGLSGKDGISIKGKDGKDAVSIKGEDGIGTIGLNGKDGITTIRTEKGEAGVDGQDGITRIIYQDPEGNEHQGATLDDGMKYSGDSGEQLKMKLNENVNIVGGITDTNQLTDNNIGVVSDGRDTLTVKLNKDITGLNSVTTETVNATTVNTTTLQAGDTTVNDNGLTINNGPSITKSGVDAGGSKITNVAPGEISATSRDAVNGSQLYASNQRIENNTRNINKLDDRLSKVGAGAAALAALHPMDFDPDDKWNVAAGIGSYKDKQAAAIGAFYRPDENTMFSIGGTVGNGENMVNAGVTFALDRRSHVSRSRTALVKDVLELKQQVAQLTEAMHIMAGTREAIMFPDVPENHWAYEYIEGLQKRGIIEGYPDGDFKGDRSMTRYEYAAMLYRALMQGEKLDARAAAEFAPELGRIRVDRIAGKDGDRNKIERVRVNDQPAKERDVYGSRMAAAEAE